MCVCVFVCVDNTYFYRVVTSLFKHLYLVFKQNTILHILYKHSKRKQKIENIKELFVF